MCQTVEPNRSQINYLFSHHYKMVKEFYGHVKNHYPVEGYWHNTGAVIPNLLADCDVE